MSTPRIRLLVDITARGETLVPKPGHTWRDAYSTGIARVSSLSARAEALLEIRLLEPGHGVLPTRRRSIGRENGTAPPN